MRNHDYSKTFSKKVDKLKGKEFENIIKKINEILGCKDLNHYKNLKGNLKKYKRVHVNNSYVILFYDTKNNIVFFEDYKHHDKIYLKRKLKK